MTYDIQYPLTDWLRKLKIVFYIIFLAGLVGIALSSHLEMIAWKCYDRQKLELEVKKSIRLPLFWAKLLKCASLLFIFTASSCLVINQRIHYAELMIPIVILFLLMIAIHEGKFNKLYENLFPYLDLSGIISSYALCAVHGILIWPMYSFGISNGASEYFQDIMNLLGKFFDTSNVQSIQILACSYFVCFVSMVFLIAITSEGLRRVLKIERFIPWGASGEYIRYWHATHPGEVLLYDDFEKLANKIFVKHRRHARFSRGLDTFGGKMILGWRVYPLYAFTPVNITISLFFSTVGIWEAIPVESKRYVNDILISLWGNLRSLEAGNWVSLASIGGSLASMLTAGVLVVGIVLAYINKPSIILGVRDAGFSQAAEALAQIELNYSEIFKNHAEIYLSSLVRNIYKSYDSLELDIIPDGYKSINFNFYQNNSNGHRWAGVPVFDKYDDIYESVAGLDSIYKDTQNKSSLWGVRRFFVDKNLNFGLIEYGRILNGYSSFGKLFPNVGFSEESYRKFSENIQRGKSESYYFKKYRDFIENCERDVLEAHIVLLEIREALWVIGKSIDESRMEKLLKSVKG